MSARTVEWDPGHYESTFSFVWNYGSDLIQLLAPQPGERILDAGCGPGQLTAKIAAGGAIVHGIDKSPAMVAQARQNYPNLTFQLVDMVDFRTPELFDAAFSNAALHWMLDPDAAAQAIAASLKPGARFIGEMAGKGNLATVLSSLESDTQNYYPSVAEYSGVLERAGFEVSNMALFDRPTLLENGIADWVAMFRPDNRRPIADIENDLRPLLFREGQWWADYRRLRFAAKKLG